MNREYRFHKKADTPETWVVVLQGSLSFLGILVTMSLILFSDDGVLEAWMVMLIIGTACLLTAAISFAFAGNLLRKLNPEGYFIAFTDSEFIWSEGKHKTIVPIANIKEFNESTTVGKSLTIEAGDPDTMHYLEIKYTSMDNTEKTLIVDLDKYTSLCRRHQINKLLRLYEKLRT